MFSQLPSHFSHSNTHTDQYVSIFINILAHERRLSGGKFANVERLKRFSRDFKDLIREEKTR